MICVAGDDLQKADYEGVAILRNECHKPAEQASPCNSPDQTGVDGSRELHHIKRPTFRMRNAGPCSSGGGIRTRDLRVMRTSYDFHRRSRKTVCGLDFLFTLGRTARGLSSSLYTFPVTGLARDYHATGFPEFDKKSHASFLSHAAQNHFRPYKCLQIAHSTSQTKTKPEPDELPLLHPATGSCLNDGIFTWFPFFAGTANFILC